MSLKIGLLVKVSRLVDAEAADPARLGQSGEIVNISRAKLDGPSVRVRFPDGLEDAFYPDELSWRPPQLTPAEKLAKHPHGTRTRYIAGGCRCARCKKANLDYYHARRRRRLAETPEVKPNGAPIPGVLMRGGRAHRVLRCPGTGGKRCVHGGTWLRTKAPVCVYCVERATVWNGTVPAAAARHHLRALSRAGVGYKSVHAACDIPTSMLVGILNGTRQRIRRETERKILAVDNSAVSDHGHINSGPTQKLIARLKKMGFTWSLLSERAGVSVATLLSKRPKVRAVTAMRVEKFFRLVTAE